MEEELQERLLACADEGAYTKARLLRLSRYGETLPVSPTMREALLCVAFLSTLPSYEQEANEAFRVLSTVLTHAQRQHAALAVAVAHADRHPPVAPLATDADWEAWISSAPSFAP